MKPGKLTLAAITSLSILAFSLSYSQKTYEVATCYNAKNQNVGVWVCASYPYWIGWHKTMWFPLNLLTGPGLKYPENCNRGTLVLAPFGDSEHAVNTLCNDRSHRKPQKLFFRYKPQVPTN